MAYADNSIMLVRDLTQGVTYCKNTSKEKEIEQGVKWQKKE